MARHCAEAECLSEIAKRTDAKTVEYLKKTTEGAESDVKRNDGKTLPPCSSCAYVLDNLGIKVKGRK